MEKNKIRLALALLLLPLLSGCMGKKVKFAPLLREETATGSILIRDVSLFDGKDTVLKTHQDVLLEGDEIRWVGPTGTTNKKTDKIIEGAGLTLMPGLVDAHVHTTASGSVPWHKIAPDAAHNLEAYLACGITTVYDLGGPSSLIKKAAEKANGPKGKGPTVFYTDSPVTAPESHPIPSVKQLVSGPLGKVLLKMILTADDPSDAPAIIAKLKEKGVHYVKLICDQIPPGSPELQENVMKALVDEAHKNGYKVFVHIGSPDNAMAAVRSGADVLAHLPWRGQLSEAQAKSIAAAKAKVILTLEGFDGVHHMCSGNFAPGEMEKKHSHPEVYEPATGEEGKKLLEQPVLGEFGKSVQANQPYWRENIRLMRDAGVEFLVGTDAPLPGGYEGGAYHRELALLNQMGISRGNLLLGATSRAAGVFLQDPEFGTVEAGKKADLLLVRGNPLQDISQTQNIELVVKRGRIFRPLNAGSNQ